jgi:hypothetical protein
MNNNKILLNPISSLLFLGGIIYLSYKNISISIIILIILLLMIINYSNSYTFDSNLLTNI